MNEQRKAFECDVLVTFKPFEIFAHAIKTHAECAVELASAAIGKIGLERRVHDCRPRRARLCCKPVKLLLDRLVEVELVTRLHGIPQKAGSRSSPGLWRCSPSFIACALPTVPRRPPLIADASPAGSSSASIPRARSADSSPAFVSISCSGSPGWRWC